VPLRNYSLTHVIAYFISAIGAIGQSSEPLKCSTLFLHLKISTTISKWPILCGLKYRYRINIDIIDIAHHYSTACRPHASTVTCRVPNYIHDIFCLSAAATVPTPDPLCRHSLTRWHTQKHQSDERVQTAIACRKPWTEAPAGMLLFVPTFQMPVSIPRLCLCADENPTILPFKQLNILCRPAFKFSVC